MTTKEKMEVMQAYLDGETIEYRVERDDNWIEALRYSPDRVGLGWEWGRNTYRIKSTTPKRIFGPKDFPPGTAIRPKGWDADGWKLVGLVTDTCFTVFGGQTYRFSDIGDGAYEGYSFSTDGGETWQRMEP